MKDMNGKVCLITGGTSGIGLATATGLAERGARILLIARNKAKGEAVRQATHHVASARMPCVF